MVHKVGSSDAEVENVDLLEDGIVEGIEEPRCVRDLDTQGTHKLVFSTLECLQILRNRSQRSWLSFTMAVTVFLGHTLVLSDCTINPC